MIDKKGVGRAHWRIRARKRMKRKEIKRNIRCIGDGASGGAHSWSTTMLLSHRIRITQFDLLFKYFYKSFALSGIEARSWAALGAIYRGALSRARTTTCGSEFCHGSSERRVALLTSAIGTQQKPKSRSLTPRRFFFDGARGFGMIGLDRCAPNQDVNRARGDSKGTAKGNPPV